VLVMVEGRFDDVYAGKERPDWPLSLQMSPDGRPLPPPPDVPAQPWASAPGKLILCGAARAFQDGVLGSPGNQLLLVNCVSALTLDPDLLEVRAKQPRSRTFAEPSAGEAMLWTLVPLAGVPLALIGVGLLIGSMRVRSRAAWDAEHGR